MRRRQNWAHYVLLGVALCAGNAVAQTGDWAVPSSGYIYDAATGNIRAISGFIGAAELGPSVTSQFDWVSIATNQKSAIVRTRASQVWIPDLSAAGTSQALDRVPLAQQAFWAADASQVALLSTGGQLSWLSDVNSALVPLSSWNLDSYSRSGRAVLSDEVNVRTVSRRELTIWSVLAADSSANQVLLLARAAEDWQIWLASSTVPPVNIPFSGRPVAAVFASDAGSVFVADATGHQIVQIQNLHTTPVVTTVVSSVVYVNNPSAIVVSSDGNRLFIADRADNVIRVFNVSAGAGGGPGAAPMAELAVDGTPSTLTYFAPDRFQMNASGPQSLSQPLYFLDTGLPARITFVPRGQ